jgi:predicted TIM-barrel fold metal-dependent hydrolase
MDAQTFIRTAFVESDTAVGVISGVPGTRNLGPENLEARRQAQEIVQRFGGPRLFYHANVAPNRGASELDYMADIVAEHRIAAWKVYPHAGPWRLDSQEVGLPFVERALELGVSIIAAHRGIASDSGDHSAPSSPVDLTNAAGQLPEATFLCYHSGWQNNIDENHSFDPGETNPKGVDRLIRGVLDAGIGPGGNVYAELGSTWRNLMTNPEAAAHVFGKLLRYLGEDRILWGTDAVFTGSPQEQIVAMRAFTIPESMQDAFGYPPLTDTARRKIFGLNAAALYGIDPDDTLCEIHGDFVDRRRLRRACPGPGSVRSDRSTAGRRPGRCGRES